MNQYRCTICGYIYDPEKGDPDNGVKPQTRFEDLPDDWVCPVCGAEKDMFEKEDQEFPLLKEKWMNYLSWRMEEE